MSHKSTGYFYYEYIYESEWEYAPGKAPPANAQGKEEEKTPPFRTAYYTEHRQDHTGQTDWYKKRVMPAVEADCKKVIDLYNGTNLHLYPKESQNRVKNRFGRVMRPFDWSSVKQKQFKWTDTLPTTTEGSQKGQPYGKRI
jgi:hypothetical protein